MEEKLAFIRRLIANPACQDIRGELWMALAGAEGAALKEATSPVIVARDGNTETVEAA